MALCWQQPNEPVPVSRRSPGASAQASGVSTAERDGAASLLCPYIALLELIGFREQVAFRALRGRPICAPSCHGAQALAPPGTGTEVRGLAASPESEAFPSAAPGTCCGQRGSAGREQRSPPGLQHGTCTAAVPSPRAGVGALPPPRTSPQKHWLNISFRAPFPSGLVAIKLPAPEASRQPSSNPQRSLPAGSRCC